MEFLDLLGDSLTLHDIPSDRANLAATTSQPSCESKSEIEETMECWEEDEVCVRPSGIAVMSQEEKTPLEQETTGGDYELVDDSSFGSCSTVWSQGRTPVLFQMKPVSVGLSRGSGWKPARQLHAYPETECHNC